MLIYAIGEVMNSEILGSSTNSKMVSPNHLRVKWFDVLGPSTNGKMVSPYHLGVIWFEFFFFFFETDMIWCFGAMKWVGEMRKNKVWQLLTEMDSWLRALATNLSSICTMDAKVDIVDFWSKDKIWALCHFLRICDVLKSKRLGQVSLGRGGSKNHCKYTWCKAWDLKRLEIKSSNAYKQPPSTPKAYPKKKRHKPFVFDGFSFVFIDLHSHIEKTWRKR